MTWFSSSNVVLTQAMNALGESLSTSVGLSDRGAPSNDSTEFLDNRFH